MNKFFYIFIFSLLFTINLFGSSTKYYYDKFVTTKKLYLGAIMSSNRKQEIECLKKLIIYGKKLHKNTSKYKRELNRLDTSTKLKKPILVKSYIKPTKKRYSIKSVYANTNMIVINFYKNINRSYIKFLRKKAKIYIEEFFIKGSFKDANPTKLKLKNIDKIKIFQYKSNILKIILTNRKKFKTVYIINKNQIIIKLVDTQKKKTNKKQVVKSKKKYTKKKVKKYKPKPKKYIKTTPKVLDKDIFYPSHKTIVIDAGHGGKDSGAVGKYKRYEKNVVLNIARYLRDELKKDGFHIYLTRSTDKFVTLPRRTKYANKKHADIFVSIHANAARRSRANAAYGIETYFLSPARSARAKRVAALENKGDMKKMSWSSKNSLLTILNQSKITESNKIAIDIQRNMLYILRKKYGKSAIKDGGVREGPFWVLVGAQMPSVLIEVGYISHPKEGYRIYTRRYQKLIAKGIARGIKSYFMKN